jgi:hypothetical protein
LSHAPGQCRHFSPEATFFSRANNCFERHRSRLIGKIAVRKQRECGGAAVASCGWEPRGEHGAGSREEGELKDGKSKRQPRGASRRSDFGDRKASDGRRRGDLSPSAAAAGIFRLC